MLICAVLHEFKLFAHTCMYVSVEVDNASIIKIRHLA